MWLTMYPSDKLFFQGFIPQDWSFLNDSHCQYLLLCGTLWVRWRQISLSSQITAWQLQHTTERPHHYNRDYIMNTYSHTNTLHSSPLKSQCSFGWNITWNTLEDCKYVLDSEFRLSALQKSQCLEKWIQGQFESQWRKDPQMKVSWLVVLERHYPLLV